MELEKAPENMSLYARWNKKATESRFGRYFECEQRLSTVFAELRAGIVCFLTVCYIIPVNSAILSETGGSCDPATDCSPETYNLAGADCRFFDSQFAACQQEMKSNLIAATCIASMIATFLMAVFARMPLAVAPAMGVNAYFTYNVVGFLGTKKLSYEQALAAAFVEGWIFILLSVTGVRGRLVELIPKNIMYATAAGIGCFLAFIGFQASEGIGFVVHDPATLVTLGGCPLADRAYSYSLKPSQLTFDNICKVVTNPDGTTDWVGQNNLGPRSPTYSCTTNQLRSATTWMGITTGAIMVSLMMKEVKASILIGILFTTFLSWIPGTEVSYLGADSQIPGGQQRKDYWKKGAVVPDVSMSAGKLQFSAFGTKELWIALITFLYLDFLDATSTMFAMARLVAAKVPGFMNSKGQWPRQLETMVVDGFAIVVGSLMGTSPLTVFGESAVGIKEGGRTGITSLMVAFGFGISMFLSPIFASIPPYATGPAIIVVGALMMEHTRYINWDSIRQSIPAFITIIAMPLTYSIAYGIIFGIASCMFLWLADTAWDAATVALGVAKDRTWRHVWLEFASSFYVSFDKEDILIAELPGYVPIDHSGNTQHGGHAHDASSEEGSADLAQKMAKTVDNA